MASEGLHEAAKDISRETRDTHRALTSLCEELEAVDWYAQRASACDDARLKAILLHNMREELEHAAMLIEWLRRRNPYFDRHLQRYLFTERPIAELETASAEDTPHTAGDDAGGGFTVGSLKE